MGLFDLFKKPTPEAQSAEQESLRRQADILMSLRGNRVPTGAMQRLQEAASGTKPWMATLTPAELMIARSHGLRPIAAPRAGRRRCNVWRRRPAPAARMRCWM
jgi:hypothetical protein